MNNDKIEYNPDIDDNTYFYISLLENNEEELENIIKTSTNFNKNAALYFAVKNNNVRIVNLLLENGADPDIQDKFGDTVLHIAVRNKNVELTTILLNKNIYVNIKNHHGQAPLHLAAKEGNIELLKLLIDKKANLGRRTRKGDTPLHLALDEGSPDSTEFLIEQTHEHHVNINIPNHELQTPIHLAIINGDEHSVKVLIEEEADLTAITKDKDTVLHLVINNSLDESENTIMTILLEAIRGLQPRQIKSIFETKNKDDKKILDLAKEKSFYEKSIEEFYKKYTKSENLSLSK